MLSRASVLYVRYAYCDSILGSSGPCGGYFGGWPVRFVRYSPPPGMQDDPNVPRVALSELLDAGYARSSFLTEYYVANCIFWALPVCLVVGFLVLLYRSASSPGSNDARTRDGDRRG